MDTLKKFRLHTQSIEREKTERAFVFFLALAVFSLSLPAAKTPALFFRMLPRGEGMASWYSRTDPCINRFTANGEVFDDQEATCASWDFPFGTYLKVTNIQDGRSVICRVNDRGPERSLDRVIDLTKSSFEKIADPDLGLIRVTVMPLMG